MTEISYLRLWSADRWVWISYAPIQKMYVILNCSVLCWFKFCILLSSAYVVYKLGSWIFHLWIQIHPFFKCISIFLEGKKLFLSCFKRALECCHGFSKYCLLLNATASICIIICIDPALYLCLLTALKVWVRSDEHNPRRDRVENVITTHLTSKWMKSIWPDVVLYNTRYVIYLV